MIQQRNGKKKTFNGIKGEFLVASRSVDEQDEHGGRIYLGKNKILHHKLAYYINKPVNI